MPRFAGIKNNNVCIVSDKNLVCNTLKIVEIPKELDHIPNNELILNYKYKDNHFVSKTEKKNISQLKVAFITNYGMTCGLSTYAEDLFPEIAKHAKDFELFIEKNDFPTKNILQFGDKLLSQDKVHVCWKRGESLLPLAEEIKKYDPDVILINHEWGIFPNARYWLTLMTQLSEYRVITIMHSIFPQHLDKIIVEQSIPEMIVHLPGAKTDLLEKKNINSKIHVIPHGCYPIINNSKLWNLYRSEYTFVQVGFGLRYKAFEDCIRATAILKEKYKDVFFTAVFSETTQGKAEHEFYYRELTSLIEELNVKDNVCIIRGFQSDTCLDAYLRTNKVAVFPYKSDPNHFVYGSSGAARLAFAKGIPVISSTIPHFSDMPTIKAGSPKDIAEKLDFLFSNPAEIKKQIDVQNNFIVENDWKKTAERYIKVLEGE